MGPCCVELSSAVWECRHGKLTVRVASIAGYLKECSLQTGAKIQLESPIPGIDVAPILGPRARTQLVCPISSNAPDLLGRFKQDKKEGRGGAV